MGKFRDLTGQTFGRWLIIRFDHISSRGQSFWLAKCSCGTHKVVAGGSLVNGRSKSCGCLQKEVAGKKQLKDITGQVFGRLVVIKFDHVSNERAYWLVSCSCRNQKIVAASCLLSGQTKSCGCLRRDKDKLRKDLTGQRFSRLLVVGYTRYKQYTKIRQSMLVCLCDCGNLVISRQAPLISGRTKSCGCLRIEKLIARNTTHGLSSTRAYINAYSRMQKELRNQLDTRWTPLMETCLRDYQPTCVVCGTTENLATDHVLPLSKGNSLYPGNAVTLCRHHNSTKHTKDLDQLPIEMATKIKEAAESFRIAWSGGF